MNWLVILAFALSSSIDNLGVGISYRIRGIRIGIWANLIIAGIFLSLANAASFSVNGINCASRHLSDPRWGFPVSHYWDSHHFAGSPA